MDNICSKKNCGDEAVEEGYCAKHYNEIIKKLIPDANQAGDDKSEDEKAKKKSEEISKIQFLALSLLAHVDRFTNALISRFSNFIELRNDETADIYRTMSRRLLKNKKRKKAIPILEKAVALKQDDAEAIYELGSAYLDESIYEKAIDCFEKAITLDSGNYEYYFKLALAYERKELFDKAITNYKKSIGIKNDESKIHHRLGIAYDGVGKYKESIKAFEKAIELNPSRSDYYQSLGLSYESLNQHDDALNCYKKAIAIQRTSI